MEVIKAVVFDIDGTVTPHANSWLATTRDLGGSVEEHKVMFFEGFKGGQVSYEDSKKRFIKFWQATGKANRSHLKDIFESWPVFPEAQELIAFLKEKGLYVAFITGSMGMYAKIVAAKFSVPDYYANSELVFDDDGNFVDFDFPHDESQRKVEHLHAFCKKRSLKPSNVVALGDSANDAGIFSETQRGIIVGLEKPEVLKKVAWKEADSLLEVKELLAPFLSQQL